MSKKSTKRALLMSILSLLLCVSMLVGTTFAWFTDNVTSGRNIIQSGNLDVELEYSLDKGTTWKPVTKDIKVFDYTLWEPGYTQVAYFKVINKGSLAVKYTLDVDGYSEKPGINKDGKEFLLSDYLYTATVPTGATREEILATTGENLAGAPNIAQGDLLAAGTASQPIALAIWMPVSVGNVANHNGTDIPVIEFAINLFATQAVKEADSFDNTYDKAAPWTGGIDLTWYAENPDASEYTLDSAEELAGLAALVNGVADSSSLPAAIAPVSFKGKTIKLGADIDLRNRLWSPIGTNANCFLANFDGQGHTIYNLNVVNDGWSGLIGHAGKGNAVTISNVNIEKATIKTNRMAGAVVGQLYGNLENCHVKDVTVTAVPNWVESKNEFDNGDKIGGVVGWLGDNNNNHKVNKCSATNVTLKAYRDVGGIAGYVAWSTTVSNNEVKGTVEITVDQITNFYGVKDFNAGAIYGRAASGGTITDTNNTVPTEGVTVTCKYAKDGIQYVEDGVTGENTLYLVPAEYEGATVTVADGITNIGGYAFAYNKSIEKIVLPSTVTTLNDRAFRDTSANTVVLNEGLENISYQAFRNATNVTTLEIPSTVKTISKEAFQNSGITTLTIPAGVDTIEYGGCRDMKKLKTVTIEGNVDIPVYAFRACTELRTVILKGDDVTFGGGSRGMIFTNTESGDGSAITVYVANETVKERLLAADTAAKDYGGYKIVVGSAVIENAGELSSAITSGETVLLGGDVQYNTPINKDAEINLAGNTFEATGTINLGNNADLTMTGGNYEVNGTYGHVDVRPSTAEGSVVNFEDVNFSFNKKEKTYGPSTNRLGSVVEVCATAADAKTVIVFKNCTFNNAQVLFEGMSGKTGEFEATFENCTFNALTSSAPIYVQNYVKGTLNVKNCTFNLECTSSTASAISISSSSSTSVTLNAENNTINAKAATPYTYDASKGETSVDTVKVNGTPANIKFVSAYTNSTVNETGTVKTGIAG